MGFGFVVDPVEPGLHRQPGQGPVLALVPVRGGDVHGPALVVQRLLEVVAVLVPALGDPQFHPGPLVHHGDGQRVQLVFASLRRRKKQRRGGEVGPVSDAKLPLNKRGARGERNSSQLSFYE